MKYMLTILLAAASASVLAEPTAAKKELIGRIIKAQQPAIETLSRGLVEQPALQILQRAGVALQTRVPPEKREAAAKEIQADLKKFIDESVPFIRDRAVKLAPTTIGVVLDEKFTEDELRQLATMMESPVNRKFMQAGGDMQRAIIEKLVAETRGTIEPKVQALEQSVARRLGLTPPPTPPKAK